MACVQSSFDLSGEKAIKKGLPLERGGHQEGTAREKTEHKMTKGLLFPRTDKI
jgi:hypothetical protein